MRPPRQKIRTQFATRAGRTLAWGTYRLLAVTSGGSWRRPPIGSTMRFTRLEARLDRAGIAADAQAPRRNLIGPRAGVPDDVEPVVDVREHEQPVVRQYVAEVHQVRRPDGRLHQGPARAVGFHHGVVSDF